MKQNEVTWHAIFLQTQKAGNVGDTTTQLLNYGKISTNKK